MTLHLKKAFEEASKLPEQEQDALGNWIMYELASERRWDELFAKSHGTLEKLAAEALEEFDAGLTERVKSNS